jgi:D-ribose pyranase
MKKTTLLHAELSALVAGLGHGELLVIGDAGLPVPRGVPCIDLAVTANVPRMTEVLAAVLQELAVERATLADELPARSPQVHRRIVELLDGVPQDSLPHDAFKALTAGARAVVRTGEFSPYANVILHAGVVF